MLGVIFQHALCLKIHIKDLKINAITPAVLTSTLFAIKLLSVLDMN